MDDRGAIIATGSNEVPRSGGGQFFPEHPDDARDIAKGIDFSRLRMREAVMDLIGRLSDAGRLAADTVEEFDEDPDLLTGQLFDGPLKESVLRTVVEYHRSAHAEESALIDAARRGVPTQGLVLYCTTFPCHLCAKLLLAAGISSVSYIEPYPKSLAEAMYQESIASEQTQLGGLTLVPYLGISPTRYSELFVRGRSLSSSVVASERRPIGSDDWSFLIVKEREDEAMADLIGNSTQGE